MYKITKEYICASDRYESLRYNFAHSKKKKRVEYFEKLCEHLGKYYKAFSKDAGYNMVPGNTVEEKKCFLEKTKDIYDFSCRLPHLSGRCGWGVYESVYSRITHLNLFADIVRPGEESSVFTDQIKKMYPTEDSFHHDVKIFKIKCVSITAAAMIVYAIFVIPLCFMIF